MRELISTEVVVLMVVGIVMACVSYRALQGNSILGNPVISICVGVLSALGFRQLSSSWIQLILDEYATLAIALLLLSLWLFLRSQCRGEKNHPPASNKTTYSDATGIRHNQSEKPEICRTHRENVKIRKTFGRKTEEQ